MTSTETYVSPATAELTLICTSVMHGFSPREALEQKVETRRQELSVAWDKFSRSVEADKLAETTHKSIIEAVESQFLAYSQALDQITSYFESGDNDVLANAAAALTEISSILLMAQAAYEERVLITGPNRFPTVNMMDNLSQRLRSREIETQRWQNACRSHHKFFSDMIAEIDASKHKDAKGIPERRAACARMLTVFDQMATLTAESPKSALDEALSQLTEISLELEKAIETFNFEAFSARPTASPEANRIIYAAKAVHEGTMAPELLHAAVDQMQATVQKSLMQVQAASRMPAETATVGEEIPKMLEALEALDDSLTMLRMYTSESSNLEFTLSQLESAVGRIEESQKHLQQQDATYGQRLCPDCQTYNPPTARLCTSCERPLARFEGSDLYGSWASQNFQVVEGPATGAGGGVIITRSMKALADASERFKKGQWTQEQYLAEIEEHEAQIRKAEAKLATLRLPEIPEEATEQEREICERFMIYGGDALALLAQGTSECLTGLLKLREFAYAPEAAAAEMRKGLQDFFDGVQKLHQIDQVAEAFVAALPPKEEGAETADGQPAEHAARPTQTRDVTEFDEESEAELGHG